MKGDQEGSGETISHLLELFHGGLHFLHLSLQRGSGKCSGEAEEEIRGSRWSGRGDRACSSSSAASLARACAFAASSAPDCGGDPLTLGFSHVTWSSPSWK